MTVETVAPMDRAEAQRVTERIRLKLDSVASGLDSLTALVADAYQRRADLAMGYESWSAYADAEFAAQTANLAAPIRRELVGRLTEAGMSTRAIAPAIGVKSDQTVRADLAKVREDHAPDPLAKAKADGRVVKLTGPGSLLHSEPVERIDMETGEVLTEPLKVTGLDGKTYTRPEPREAIKPRRPPLTDMFADVLYELDRRVESLARLIEDDRFPTNRETIRLRSLAQAKKTATTLAGVLAAMDHNNDSSKG